ncbi:glutamate racemase [Parasphingopyxis algicola]|uniref:glutamate racemase n=1 Tax=Parasphingopyxis algicola TaxID=2026624 RepID=UPI0015A2E68F|nr:glutamate racemase [Parasphingopyxis algicola]QLC24443.1 glutamate racemase [Parasphingopyxis algicola]
MRADQPLLLLDTGVGGLSILGPIRKLLPRAPIVYALDQAGFPYGQKSEAELAARVPALLGRLAEHVDARLAVIACNTASVIALDPVRAALAIPIVGTVPAIKPAAAISKSRVIGVLGTAATVRQPYVDNLSREFASDCTVIRHGSHELVALAEQKMRSRPTDPNAYARVLDGLFGQPGGDKIDTIVLSCTHFPLVEAELAAASPHPVAFVHGGDGIARRVAHLTEGQPWPEEPRPGTAIFVSDGSDPEPLRPGLAQYGFENFETL